jgi:nucleoside-specific outer membrane channel protein Tsx
MPTIEIASIDSPGLGLNQADFDVTVIEENKLRSHRGLFSDLLKLQNGSIVHIGNPDLKDSDEGGCYAGAIIDWDFEPCYIVIPKYDENDPVSNSGADQQFRFKFLEQFKPEIDKLLKLALNNSPVKRVYFLTDYQFGPADGKTEIIFTISDFWAAHDNAGLGFNMLYEMYGR